MPRSAHPRNEESPALAGLLVPTGATGLEPATSGVTGRRSNQLSYAPRARGNSSALPPGPSRGGRYETATWRFEPVSRRRQPI